MKKLSALFLMAAFGTTTMQAQEAFKHLGMSLEVGPTGAGINLSYPLVTDHLILSVGYNLPSISVNADYTFSSASVNGKINEANSMIKKYNSQLQDPIFVHGLESQGYSTQPINELSTISELKAGVEAKLNFGQFKAMVEWYPTLQSNFHITAGVFIGNGEWLNIDTKVEDQTWSVYQAAVDANNQLPASPGIDYNGTHYQKIDGLEKAYTDNARFTVDGQTFALYKVNPETKEAVIDSKTGQPIPLQQVKATLKVAKVKPYIGLGFGSSIPRKHRCGFQMEVGMYYQQRPSLESDQEIKADPSAPSDKYLNDIMKTIKHFTWYPQVSFRLTGRLF